MATQVEKVSVPQIPKQLRDSANRVAHLPTYNSGSYALHKAVSVGASLEAENLLLNS
jgi:hypothetical protein